MPTKLKTSLVTVAAAVAFNFTVPGQAFAVWCSTDAVQVYQNMVTNFMPFVSGLMNSTGLSAESAVIQSGAGVRGEILKSATAEITVDQGIESFAQQEALRIRAIEVAAALQLPANTCQAIATSTSLTGAEVNGQRAAYNSQRSSIANMSTAANTNTLTKIDAAYKKTNDNFCSEEDAARKICDMNTLPAYKTLAGSDHDAMFLFQSRDGSSTYQGDGKAQETAVDAYIDRVVGGIPPQALSGKGEDFYNKNPQARAYVELARRYASMLSAGSYSLNQIKVLHAVQVGLGTDSKLASVKGFESNKADMSMSEAVERFVSTKFSADSVAQAAQAQNPNLILRDLAQMSSFQLWMSFQGMRQSQRVESLQAHQLALIADQVLRPQLDAQRALASKVTSQAK